MNVVKGLLLFVVDVKHATFKYGIYQSCSFEGKFSTCFYQSSYSFWGFIIEKFQVNIIIVIVIELLLTFKSKNQIFEIVKFNLVLFIHRQPCLTQLLMLCGHADINSEIRNKSG